MMEDYYTHAVAILVGVVITLGVIGQFSGSKTNDGRDRSSSLPAAAAAAAAKSAPATSTTTTSTSVSKNKKKKKKSKAGGVVAEISGEEHVAPPRTSTAATTTTSASAAADGVVTVPVPAVTDKVANTTAVSVNGGGGKKKKNTKKGSYGTKSNGGSSSKAASASASASATADDAVVADSEPEPNQKPEAATAAPPPPSVVTQAYIPTPPAEEEWSHVKDTKKKPKGGKRSGTGGAVATGGATVSGSGAGAGAGAGGRPNVTSSVPAATNGAAAPSVATAATESVVVDAKKVGIIIGPKGATMQAIQALTGCKLDINAPAKDDVGTAGAAAARAAVVDTRGKSQQQQQQQQAQTATIVITGTGDAAAMRKAKVAIKELATRGYATLLQSETFGEQCVRIHPRYLSEIVGTQGKVIQAIQSQLNVKVTIPPTEWRPTMSQDEQQRIPLAKVGVAGDNKQNLVTAKDVIESLVKYHHHEITHPGTVHEEVYVPQEFFHCVIGTRGSEIKHIRGNFGVDIYMPNQAWDDRETVLVVGKTTNVERAIAYIQRLMDRDTEQRAQKYNDEYYG